MQVGVNKFEDAFKSIINGYKIGNRNYNIENENDFDSGFPNKIVTSVAKTNIIDYSFQF